MTKKELLTLNKTYLNAKYHTDVITFLGKKLFNFAGEICISIDYAKYFSNKYNISFSEEITRYLIHGWLHLAGLKDDNKKDKYIMNNIENKIIQLLINNKLMTKFLLII